MRYQAGHKERTHRRIVESAARQFRTEGMNGPGVAKLMKASGLTHGGFYKHFTSKDQLFAEAIAESVREVGAMVTGWAKQAPRGECWKEIVKRYLSMEHCEHPGMGCPVAALAPDIARARAGTRRKIRDSMEAYKKWLLQFMPGGSSEEKQKNLALIFTAMVGALTVARTVSDREEREKLLALVRNHLLTSF
jgi:TetR/AcrR family transcriptional regulator, transcriptional repressor for nem operon